MAMNLGEGSRKKGLSPEMNVTPLVDVVLVLLIIFMVITPLLTKGFWLHTPKQEKEEVEKEELAADPQPPLVLRVAAERTVTVNGADVPLDELALRLKRMFAARDHMGRRPLFFATTRSSLAIASSTEALLAHPDLSSQPDLIALVGRISFGLADEKSSAFREVLCVPAAHTLTAERGGSPRLTRYWTVPAGEETRTSFDDGVAELRALIEHAALERMDPAGTTSIWLSGGYDSPALFGIAERALAKQGDSRRLHPVSMSHPPDDPAREDEIIAEIVGFWNRTPTWVDISEAPLLENLAEYAAGHDDPFQHAFERWSRVMLAAARRVPSRVVFSGDGGDQLFAVSRVFLRDLFAGGRWGELSRGRPPPGS